MGNRCTKSPLKQQTEKTYSFPINNEANFNSLDTIQKELKFHVIFSNFKAKHFETLQKEIMMLSFTFDSVEKDFTLDVEQNKAQWKQSETFYYITSTQKIKKSYAVLTLKDREENQIASFSLNIYEIATGPSYHDIYIQNKKIKGKISFELKMYQTVRLEILPENIKCEFNENDQIQNFSYNSQDFFAFFLSIISPEGIVQNIKSNLKQVLKNKTQREEENFDVYDIHEGEIPLQKQIPQHQKSYPKNFKPNTIALKQQDFKQKIQNSEQLNQQLASIGNKEKNKITPYQIQNVISDKTQKIGNFGELNQHKKYLYLDFQSRQYNVTDNKIIIEIEVKEIKLTTLKISIWKDQQMDNMGEDEEQKPEENLIGNCFVSLNKIIREDILLFEIDELKDWVITNQQKTIKENLWKNGIYIGKFQITFRIKSNPFVRQMICGVRTELGIRKTTLPLLKNCT